MTSSNKSLADARDALIRAVQWVLDNEQVTQQLRERYDAILDALAVMAGETPAEPALAITDEMRADAREALRYSALFHFARKHLGAPDHPSARPTTGTPAYEALRQRVQAIADSEPEPVADTDPMPTPPEGVTVRRIDTRGWEVWCITALDREDVLWVRDGVPETCVNGLRRPTVAALRYAADLAEWAARQHTRTRQAEQEAERQRLRDAVREAEEAYGRAWAAHATACEGLKAARDRADETLEVADGYKLAVDKAREAARKGGAL